MVCVSESLVLLTPTHRQAEEGKEVAVEEERVEVTVEKVARVMETTKVPSKAVPTLLPVSRLHHLLLMSH